MYARESSRAEQDTADSAYVFVGGLPFELTEGDVITIMSQFVHLFLLSYTRH